MGKHTNTPWKVDKEISPKAIYSESGWLIAQTNTIHDQKLGAEANAAFIVTSCNNHFALVEALLSCYNELKSKTRVGESELVLRKCETALTQVEKG